MQTWYFLLSQPYYTAGGKCKISLKGLLLFKCTSSIICFNRSFLPSANPDFHQTVHSVQHHGVKTVTLDHSYSIDATEKQITKIKKISNQATKATHATHSNLHSHPFPFVLAPSLCYKADLKLENVAENLLGFQKCPNLWIYVGMLDIKRFSKV